MLLKFGIGAAAELLTRFEKLITRDEGVELVKKFDAEFPSKSREVFMNYCGYDEFWHQLINGGTRPLEKDGAGNWVLKYQVE